MQLAPGPLPQLDTSWYPVTFDPPDFEHMVNDWWVAADSIVAEMDSWMAPDLTIDDGLTGDTIYADLDAADHVNGDNAASINLAGIDTGDGMKANGDAALVAAAQSIPGEAFTPVPASTGYATVTQPAPTAQIAGVALANLSGGDPQIYVAGDQFQLVVRMDTTTGHVADYFNVHIYAVMTLNGISQPNLELGHTDASGSVTYRGQWQASDVGSWTMHVHADPTTGGDVVSIPYSWTVSDVYRAPSAGLRPIVTVQLVNVSSGSLNNNRSGDLFQLTVSGPPNQPVYISGTHDGQTLSEVEIGTTDGSGAYILQATWSDQDIGDWVEYYRVGSYAWRGSLQFTVEPAAG